MQTLVSVRECVATLPNIMPTLYLMRHAKSSWDNPHHSDHERPLNERGRREGPLVAAALCEHLTARGATCHAIVCSDARRTRETAALVQAAFGEPPPLSPTSDLYHAGVGEWAAVVAQFDPAWETVVAIAHNPGLSDLHVRLGGGGHIATSTAFETTLPSWDALLEAELGPTFTAK